MWRHFPHHSHAICGEISDFYTSVTRRNLKLLHMWRKFRFLHICHVERFEITLHVEKFQKSPHLSCIEIWNFSTWQFFLHRYIGGIGDKYEVWCNVISNKLEILEDALFECSNTSTHKMEKLAHWKNSVRKTEKVATGPSLTNLL